VISKTLAVFLGAATLLGIFTVFSLVRIEVSPDEDIDQHHPYPYDFTIHNVGLLELTDVAPAVGLCKTTFGPTPDKVVSIIPDVQDTGPDGCVTPINNVIYRTPVWDRPLLERDDKYSFPASDALRAPSDAHPDWFPQSVEFSLLLSFKALGWPMHREYHFRTVNTDDGKLKWRSEPVTR
jgi:hypothetical protein